MSDSKPKSLVEMVEAYSAKLAADPEFARSELVDMGIYTPGGRLTRNYSIPRRAKAKTAA